MNERLQRALALEYPTVYRDLGGDVRHTCMGWGITCGDGWFLILWRLGAVLEPMGAVAHQVKEKYGTLHFYFGGGEDAADEAVCAAERESETTCETCGRPGRTISPRGWYLTLCEEHETEEKNR